MLKECRNPGQCKVIIVEDDPMLRMVLSIQLESAKINFCAAADGHAALSLIKSHLPLVLLLDVSMPGLSGFEIINAMRHDPVLAALHSMNVIVHTSHDLGADEQKNLSFGKTQFLTKTKLTEELSAITNRLLNSAGWS